jgi:hypothetical protein
MSTSTTHRTELAHRTSEGIDVYLFWNEPTSRVSVSVLDTRADEGFELDVDGRHALDAFNHPYAYAARIQTAADGHSASADTGGNPEEPTSNPTRSDHARTNR